MHGYTVDEIIQCGLKEIDRDITPDQMAALMGPIMAGETLGFEVMHYKKDGSTFPMAVTSKLVTVDGKPVIMALHRDITVKKRNETLLKKQADENSEMQKKIIAEKSMALTESQAQLVESSRLASLGEMASSIAHEINNPLSVITARTTKLVDLLKANKFEKVYFEELLTKISGTAAR